MAVQEDGPYEVMYYILNAHFSLYIVGDAFNCLFPNQGKLIDCITGTCSNL